MRTVSQWRICAPSTLWKRVDDRAGVSMLKIKVKRRSDQRAASQDTRHVFSCLPVLIPWGGQDANALSSIPLRVVSLPRDFRLFARNAAPLFAPAHNSGAAE
jgi:hypothetical protein